MKQKKWKIGRHPQTSDDIQTPVEPYASATDRASERDRIWFEEHPEAFQRVRDYIAGEFREEVPPIDHKILVTQIKPGVRARTSIPPVVVDMFYQGIVIFTPEVRQLQQML